MATRQEKASVCNQSARAQRKGIKSTLTVNDWLTIKAACGGRCAYCGSDADLSPDHILPLSRGGGNTPENVTACCFACNKSKQDRTPEEWFAGLPAPRLYGRALLNARLKKSAENTS